MDQIRTNQAKKEFAEAAPINRHFPEEPKTVAVKERKIHVPVQLAKNLVGIKEDIGSLAGQAAIKQEIIGEVALEMLFGTTSATYLKLYNEGIID
ncbi:peptidase M16, partial [Listeria monocytogenes]|nr:peptidase M16 [Listeria monocytogenes]